MVVRPEGLILLEVELEFNFQTFTGLEIDLKHVNKEKRSHFSANEVVVLVEELINGLRLLPSDEKQFGEEICSYFVRTSVAKGKKYKLVFCICSDRPTSIGVITLHRM